MARPQARTLLALLLVGGSAAFVTRAADFTVDATFDATDAAPGDGFCATAGGEVSSCTLRAAIMEANALAGADTIHLPAGSYVLDAFGPSENDAETGDLDIDGALSIVGAGRDVTIVDAAELDDRVFEVLGGGAFGGPVSRAVSISGLTITGGRVFVGEAFGFVLGGGGIRNAGDLTLTDCRVSDNTATFFTEGGGGIANAGTLLVDGCELLSNRADDSVLGGGGLLNTSAATLVDSSFVENTAEEVGSGGGGGIANLGSLAATRCDVSGNSAADSGRGGGGIYHAGEDLIFLDGTISGNDASVGDEKCASIAGGGGLSIFEDFVFVSGTTISDNSANAGCEGQPDGGGGVHSSHYDYLFFVNTTISGNSSLGATYGGGGFLCVECFAELYNCTVTDNRVVDEGDFLSGQSGGGLSVIDGGTIAYENTIVLGNLRETISETVLPDDCAQDGSNDLVSNGHNLLGSAGGCPADGTGDTVAAGTAGVLGALEDNGGPTLTHALLPGSSPAIDGGDPAGCTFDDSLVSDQPLDADQRAFTRPIDGDGDSLAVCDIGAYELGPANPPDCSRLLVPGAPTDEIVGLATDDDRAADTGIFQIELIEADGVALLPPGFVEGDPAVTFVVECVDPTPGDDLCEGSGVVRVTDGEGLTCTLGVEFSAVPAGPLAGFVFCQGDGTLLQIDNPAEGSSDPLTPEGTGACSIGGLNGELPPLPPGRGPVPECDVFVIDSPVEGLTNMVYKVEINNLNLRLLFSEFDDDSSTFQVWQDITRTVELIVQVVPDPTRMSGERQWSPVMITCAELIEIDCDDPLNVDADRDGDGVSPCPSDPAAPVDCDDNLAFVRPGALELCNGIDDDCDGSIDDGLDADGDTVADCFDNCPDLSNPPEICDPALPPFQCDSDGDGIGDPCDFPGDGDDEDEDEDCDDEEMDDEPFDAGVIQILQTGDPRPGQGGSAGPAQGQGAQSPSEPGERRSRQRKRPERGPGS